ncbi:MAG TPA: zinc metallopeptidase [Victivallales bacterium]|nr:zinc metallopeptidase [Victivallales bacterium]
MFFFDPMYLLFAVPGLILAMLASFYTKSTFAKYAKITASTGLTGAMAAQKMLNNAGIYNVRVEQTQGFLSDHYDPRTKTLRLSPDVFNGRNLSAIGVACHEAGHAIQHANAYSFLSMRTALVPATNFCSSISYIVIIAGFIFAANSLVLVGAVLFSVAVLFSIITLPVEWDASARAKKMMVNAGIVSPMEAGKAGQVLNAAFLTYVAAAISSLMTLLYFLLRSGIFGGSE